MRHRFGCGAVIVGMALQSLAFVSGVLPASAQAPPPPASDLQRPALQIGSAGRFNEDWSVLKGVDLGTTDDFWDRVKFMPLTSDGSVWLSLGGQARERAEYFRHFLIGASEPKDTDAYLLSRHVQVYAGYSRFFPGEFVEKTGPSRDSDFLYGAIQYTF